jgi:hypothetical protein
VVLTLAYLARQVRQANRQDLLSSFQHTYDSINEFLLSTMESSEVADLVVRGRESYEALSEPERLRFDHFHLVILNIVEAHLFQVDRTTDALEKDYREWARENMEVVVQSYFDFHGTRTLWSNLKPFFEPSIRDFVSRALDPAAASSAVEGQVSGLAP